MESAGVHRPFLERPFPPTQAISTFYSIGNSHPTPPKEHVLWGFVALTVLSLPLPVASHGRLEARSC